MKQSQYTEIPCCYFPTTTILIDDDVQFIKSMHLVLDTTLNRKSYNNPIEALNYLTKKYESILQPESWSAAKFDKYEQEINLLDSEVGYVIDFLSIHKMVYIPNRFDEVSTVISDYSMPEINGVELFSRLQNFAFQKFLLTGVASESIGLDAFNDGKIDKFIAKKPMSLDFKDQIKNIVKDLQKRYFKIATQDIMQKLSLSPKSCIGEPSFNKLFNEVIQENNIVEYYLVHETGCFVLLDYAGNVSWLVVKSENDMKYYYDSAVDNEASNQIINSLENRSEVLFLFSEKDDNAPYEEWGKYLHPAKILEGEKNKFYYSYIKNNPVYDSQLEKIVSYKDFLEKGLTST
ncbi:MAG: hypothetical protein PVG30_01380 [Gammaproteobacteria bacterium]|jgi:CheY-like chemotaxis protein